MLFGYSTESSVDKGWAWMILLGTFIWNVSVSGTLKSFGVLYVEFIDNFGTTPTQTGWIGFTFAFMMLVLSPLAGCIGDNFSPRWIIFFGSLVASSGVFLTGFARSLLYAVLSYGIISGSAVGIMDCFVFGTLNKYFHKRRAFANSISFMGSGIGCLAIPILLRMCVDIYNLQGTMFILSGIWLHSCIIGALFRPIKFKEVFHEKTVLVVMNLGERSHEDDINSTSYKENGDISSTDLECHSVINNTERSNNFERNNEIVFNDSSPGENDVQANANCNNYSTCEAKANANCNNYSTCEAKANANCNNYSTCEAKANANCNNYSTCEAKANANCNNYSTCEAKPNANCNNSTYAAKANANCNNSTCASKSLTKRTSKHSKFKKGLQDYCTFLKNPPMIRVVLAIMFGSFAYFNQLFLFPPLSKELQFSKMQGALLVALTGTTEVCSRLPLGYLCDKPFMNKELLVASLSVLSCVVGLTVSFIPTRLVFTVYCCVLGVIGGTTVPLGMPMLADVVHTEMINSAAGLFLWAMGIAIAVGPPMLGAIQMYFGSYIYSYRLCVTMYIPAAVLLSWNVVTKYLQKKTQV